MHKRKLREVKSAIRPLQEKPYAPQIQMRNAKKDAMLERRYTEIERENRILLEKMSNIMQSNKPSLYNPSRSQKRSLNISTRKTAMMKI
jgi:E3 ubiquitin-protein ligase TRIP12